MAADQRCFRCDEPLADAHRIFLASTHEGEYAERFRDIDRRICLDCLAAIGMLEFVDGGTDPDETPISLLRNRLPPVRSRRGGD